MLDGVSFDQLRVFIAAAEAGSFSAAGRNLRRAQSVVSQTIANLEAQLGVALFARSGRYPVLTEAGRLLLADARAVSSGVDSLKARARGMAAGIEPELSVAIDVMFPMPALTCVAAQIQRAVSRHRVAPLCGSAGRRGQSRARPAVPARRDRHVAVEHRCADRRKDFSACASYSSPPPPIRWPNLMGRCQPRSSANMCNSS